MYICRMAQCLLIICAIKTSCVFLIAILGHLTVLLFFLLVSFQREGKLEDLNLLFINIHHLINELRPHQVSSWFASV